MKQVIITITPEGLTTVEAHGFKGKACTDATAQIEKALGLVSNRKKKPEYLLQASKVSRQSISGS